MEANQPREIGEYLKSRYREEPASARIMLKAAAVTSEGISHKIGKEKACFSLTYSLTNLPIKLLP